MATVYKQGIYNDWVPPKLRIIGAFIILLPLLTINGVYTFNINDLVGSLGDITEDITYAYYASTVGMVAVFPFVIRIRSYIKSRNIMLFSLLLIGIISLICANTSYMPVLILGNFVLGMLKFVGLMELMGPMMQILSPKGDRSRLYAFYYPITIAAGQVSGWVTAELAYRLSWQYVYYFAIPFILIAILTVFILFHSERTGRKIPLYQLDWMGFLLFSIILLLINYIFVYGKYEDWFNSIYIQAAVIVLPVLIILFIKNQLSRKRPYLNLSVLRHRNVYIGLILMALMQFLFSTGSIQSSFTTSIMKLDMVHSSSINMLMIPGAIIGALACFHWFKHQKGYRGIIFIGFSALILYHLILYFYFHPNAGQEDLVVPMILKGFGLIVLYIAIALLVVNKLPMKSFMAAIFLLMVVRSALGPAVFTSMYNNWFYRGQVQSTTELANNMEALNPNITTRYQPTYQNAISQGRSVEVAQSIASQSLYNTVQQQSLMITAKKIFGVVTFSGVLILIYVLIVQMIPANKRKQVKWRNKYGTGIPQRVAELLNAPVD